MKTATELYDEWTDGAQNGMRPKRVQTLRDDLAEATGLAIPHRVSEIEGWLDAMSQSGVITRKLEKASEGSDGEDGGESDE